MNRKFADDKYFHNIFIKIISFLIECNFEFEKNCIIVVKSDKLHESDENSAC